MEMTDKDLKNLQNKVDAEMRSVSDVIDPIVGRLYKKMDDLQEAKGNSSEKVPTCGTCKAVKNMKSTDISSGGAAGGARGYVTLPEIGTPKWVKELKDMVKGFAGGSKQRGKEYYDPEDLIRGMLTKQSEKQLKKSVYVYTVLDTSGSMNSATEGGISFIQLMMRQIPAIVREYEGEVILCDTDIHYPIMENRKIRKALGDAGNFTYAGGGGTDFSLAYDYVLRQLLEIRIKKPQAEALVITLTDAGVFWDIDKIKELKNFVVVTTPKEKRNVKAITDALPPQEYPNVRNIFIR